MDKQADVQDIRNQVQKKFPNYVPHLIKKERIASLLVEYKAFQVDIVGLLLQQSVLAEALAAYGRGESVSYLKNLRQH